jgi:hypothetical protein
MRPLRSGRRLRSGSHDARRSSQFSTNAPSELGVIDAALGFATDRHEITNSHAVRLLEALRDALPQTACTDVLTSAIDDALTSAATTGKATQARVIDVLLDLRNVVGQRPAPELRSAPR